MALRVKIAIPLAIGFALLVVGAVYLAANS